MSAHELTAGAAPDPVRSVAERLAVRKFGTRVAASRSVADTATALEFERQFEVIFATELPRLQRVVIRLSGDAELAADVVQDAFIRLFRRGSLPDAPRQWLITVVLNLYRNAAATSARRCQLLQLSGDASDDGDASPVAHRMIESAESQRLVRAALSRLPDRECRLLMLMAEGYSYREIAGALHLNESSIGTLLMRAKAMFRDSYGNNNDAR